ncbi:M48 family metalloprotease [Myroides indicus]|uniref:Peptidase M48-like protein n=1 Tax=Myroides indicus TaxID=1323422 RepID=A0A4R7F862_9FLAO|nr:M48 family metalloprotease [Myroides indicus]TDS65101.1 peptidase M48-like protein [Myroides indicus]
MKSIYIIILFLISINISAQEIILLDTLHLQDKKKLKDKYNERKSLFLSQLNHIHDKKEVKEIKAIFEENYKDINNKIDRNELIFDSPLNNYLNDLGVSIQKENPEIPKNISILISREYSINAFNRGEGTIIVNNYLLNALDHEDQLVYILCHEMAHQTLNHVLESVTKHVQSNNSLELKKQTKQLKKQKYNQKTKAENLLMEIAYKNSAINRAKELQADSLGYVFYSRLNRDPYQVVKTLEILRDSDKEGDSITIKDYEKLFTSFKLQTKEQWFKMESFDQYNYQKNTKFNTDSLSTHPNCDIRIEKLVNHSPEIKKTIQQLAPSSDTFLKWQKSAVYQNIQNEYFAKNYGNSLYEALKLYNRKPDPLLKKWIGLNFIKLYEAKKSYELNKYISQVNIAKYTHSYNLFSTFIFNLTLSDLETICKSFNS